MLAALQRVAGGDWQVPGLRSLLHLSCDFLEGGG